MPSRVTPLAANYIVLAKSKGPPHYVDFVEKGFESREHDPVYSGESQTKREFQKRDWKFLGKRCFSPFRPDQITKSPHEFWLHGHESRVHTTFGCKEMGTHN